MIRINNDINFLTLCEQLVSTVQLVCRVALA